LREVFAVDFGGRVVSAAALVRRVVADQLHLVEHTVITIFIDSHPPQSSKIKDLFLIKPGPPPPHQPTPPYRNPYPISPLLEGIESGL
jgi:hypothetical protein